MFNGMDDGQRAIISEIKFPNDETKERLKSAVGERRGGGND